MQRFLLLLRSNWISATGAITATLAFMLFITTFVFLAFEGSEHTAYSGLIAFVMIPSLFVVGLALIPIGWVVYRKHLKERMAAVSEKPIHLVRLLAILTVVNLAVAGTGGYQALEYMDSQQFCGTLCHEVMSPTYGAYEDSAHARVSCTACHIGSGASWFVKSKLSGLRQVIAVMTDSFQRPIPTPVHNLRPARDTCEQCHWPDKFSGDRLVVRQHFGNDEAVTPETTVLVLKTGGTRPDGNATGIHWHVHPGNEVSYYASDERRETIPWVRLRLEDGTERIFTTEEFDDSHEDGALPPEAETRTMDCIDCHNQPSHGFEDRDNAIDKAIAGGLISRRLPFVRKVGIEALDKDWTRDSAADGIRGHLDEFYAGQEGLSAETKALIPAAAEVISDIWLRNIHPDMKVTWGTYPNMQGHKGCFRCHDGNHMDEDGEEISMDCETCHTTLADRETNPAVLQKLGLNPR